MEPTIEELQSQIESLESQLKEEKVSEKYWRKSAQEEINTSVGRFELIEKLDSQLTAVEKVRDQIHKSLVIRTQTTQKQDVEIESLEFQLAAVEKEQGETLARCARDVFKLCEEKVKLEAKNIELKKDKEILNMQSYERCCEADKLREENSDLKDELDFLDTGYRDEEDKKLTMDAQVLKYKRKFQCAEKEIAKLKERVEELEKPKYTNADAKRDVQRANQFKHRGLGGRKR